MRLSFLRPRFRLQTLMIAGVVAWLALIYAMPDSSGRACGRTPVSIAFRVVDDRDGRPISGATISVFDGDMSPPPMASEATGPDGVARVTFRTGCTWHSRPFFQSSRSLVLGEFVRIKAPGYRKVECLIPSLESGRIRSHLDLRDPPPFVIRLDRASPIAP